MRTWNEFYQEHKGHELVVPGEEYPKTVHVTYGNIGFPGDAECPKCGVKEQVMVTGKICDKHPRGEHIVVRCKKCGATGTTKNIDWIGARGIFLDEKTPEQRECEHSDCEHLCEVRKV